MPKYKVLVAQFPYGSVTHIDAAKYVSALVCEMRSDPDIGPGGVALWDIADTPVTMSRNRCLLVAEQAGVDYVLMIDSDMRPDLYLDGGGRPADGYEFAKPFWSEAWTFARDHAGPCVIAAPYCGPPPEELVYVFRWTNRQTDDPNPNYNLAQFTRAEAVSARGIQRVDALPTGLMLLDMRAVQRLRHPRFYYEWIDETASKKASTEDVTFSRDLGLAGVPLYVTWDAWAGHWKSKCVMRPKVVDADSVCTQMKSDRIVPPTAPPAAARRCPSGLTAGDNSGDPPRSVPCPTSREPS